MKRLPSGYGKLVELVAIGRRFLPEGRGKGWSSAEVRLDIGGTLTGPR